MLTLSDVDFQRDFAYNFLIYVNLQFSRTRLKSVKYKIKFTYFLFLTSENEKTYLSSVGKF